MHYFHNLSSLLGALPSDPHRGSIPGPRWGIFDPIPLICPPLETILWAPMSLIDWLICSYSTVEMKVNIAGPICDSEDNLNRSVSKGVPWLLDLDLYLLLVFYSFAKRWSFLCKCFTVIYDLKRPNAETVLHAVKSRLKAEKRDGLIL